MRYLFVLLMLWAGQAYAAQGDIITLAGLPNPATLTTNVLANQTAIGSQGGIAVDTVGNVYFVEGNSKQIKKIDRQTGILSSVATIAGATSLTGLVFSPAGVLYVSDYVANRVQKIDLNTGLVSFFATVNSPRGMALDNAGNLYVANYLGGQIHKIDAAGNVTVVLSGLSNPLDLAFDRQGNLFFTEFGTASVKKWSAGVLSTVITSPTIQSANGIAIDSADMLYVSDAASHVVQKLDLSTGTISRFAGKTVFAVTHSGDGGSALQAGIVQPSWLAVDAYANVYIRERIDTQRSYIRMVGNVIDIPASISFPVVDTYGAQQYFQSLKLTNSSGATVQNIHYQLPTAIVDGSFVTVVQNNFYNQASYQVPVFVSDHATGGLGARSVAVTYNGVRLHALNIIASPPDRVDILLRAVESNTTNDKPVTTMTQQDFMVEEDGLPLSVESKVLIKKVTELKHVVQTVLMFDVSSSISATNLQLMKQSVKNALIDPNTGLLRTKDQQVAIYTFDDTVRLVQDFTSNATIIAQAINGITSQGVTSTNLYGAIIQGMAKPVTQASLTSLSEGHVVVITDGRDTSGYFSVYQATAAINASENTLHLIGVQSPDLQPATMQQLSKHYTEVGNFSAVEQAMTDIAAYTDALAYSFYQVYYNSPARAGTHTLTVYEKHSNYYTNKITGSFDTADFTPPAPTVPSSPANNFTTQDQQQSCLVPSISHVWVWLMMWVLALFAVRVRQTTS